MTYDKQAGRIPTAPGHNPEDPMSQNDQPAHVPLRDPETGALNFKVHVDVHHPDHLLPLSVDCRDWQAALTWLRSAEFKRMRDQVEFVTITNRERP